MHTNHTIKEKVTYDTGIISATTNYEITIRYSFNQYYMFSNYIYIYLYT